MWSRHAQEIYFGNPNVAPPGSEGDKNLQWVPHFRGTRLYCTWSGNRIVFNRWFRATPGEIFLKDDEIAFAGRAQGKIIVEPMTKYGNLNKRWPEARFRALVKMLIEAGHDCAQFVYGTGNESVIDLGVSHIKTWTFRQACGALSGAKLYIGPEGGLHHAAAAMGIPAVVIFGGFIHPRTTGYDLHTNLFVGDEPCGSTNYCVHCVDSMNAISVQDVFDAAIARLGQCKPSIP